MNFKSGRPRSGRAGTLAVETEPFPLLEAANETGSPERNLLMAVLERAMLDFVGNDPKEIDSVEEWIFSDLEDPAFEPFSFSWICQQLDLEPTRIARIIRDMPKRGTNRIAPWYFNKGFFEENYYKEAC